MIGLAFLALLFLSVGFTAGNLMERKARPRHRHAYEILEKERLPSMVELTGETPGQLMAGIKAVSRSAYVPDTSSAMAMIEPHFLIHKRCTICGDERVEHI